MKKQNKIMLFTVPNYNAVYMHPAIPYLTSYLRHNGFEVIQKDLNVLAYDFYLSRDYLKKCLKKAKLEYNRKYLYILNNIEKAKRSMQDSNVYKNFKEFSKNKEILEGAFDILYQVKKERVKLMGNTFYYKPREYYTEEDKKISYKSREGLLKTIRHKEDNFFYDFFKERVISLVKKEQPALVGISVCDQKQLVTAFVLSAMIKEEVNTKIVLGGTIITRIYDVISRDDDLNRKLFEYIDFIIHNEGEFPLNELAKRLTNGKKANFEDVPKLIYKNAEGRITENLKFDFTPMEKIPAPDYDGFNEKHWTPQPIIAYLSKRGCAHSCSFCDIPFGYDGYCSRIERKLGKKFNIANGKTTKAKTLSVDRVIGDIQELKRKYNSKYFSFSDEELLGNWLEIFCKRLLEEKVDIDWECYARMEPKFKDKEFVKLIGKAGCRFIQFGLESVSQKILNYESKMTKATDYEMILKNTVEEGIMNHAFFVIGMPYDNLFESMKILAFLEKNGKYIHTIKPITYKISKWSPNALNPESKGLSVDENTPDLDVNLNMREKPTYGMSLRKARIFVKILELWVEQKHKVNPVTRTYIYAQRMFITPKLMKKFSKQVKVKEITAYEEEYLKRFSEILKAELKKFAYLSKEAFIEENIKKEYSIFRGKHSEKDEKEIKKIFINSYKIERERSSRLYNLEKKRRKFFDETYRKLKTKEEFLSLDELIEFSERLQEIDTEVMRKLA